MPLVVGTPGGLIMVACTRCTHPQGHTQRPCTRPQGYTQGPVMVVGTKGSPVMVACTRCTRPQGHTHKQTSSAAEGANVNNKENDEAAS